MYKSLVVLCVVFCVVIEGRPKWQFLPHKPGYVPVYIRAGDTPLEDINPELAEAFHALPSGRSAGKLLDAAPEVPEASVPEAHEAPEAPEQADQPQPDVPQIPESIDRRPYEKKFLETKTKKATFTLSAKASGH